MFAEIPVSVFTMCRDKKRLEQTCAAMHRQTFPWFEWIVVLERSVSKADEEAIYKIAETDRRICIHRQEGNTEAAGDISRYCRAEYIAVLQAGDSPAPAYLEYMYWMLYYHPDACGACVGGSIDFVSGRERGSLRLHAGRSIKGRKAVCHGAMFRRALRAGGKEGQPEIAECGKAEFGGLWLWIRGRYLMQSEAGLLRYSGIGLSGKIPLNMDIALFPGRRRQQTLYPPQFREWKERTEAVRENSVGILWLVPWMSMGGSERFNLDAVSGLQESGYKNYFAATVAGGKQWLEKFEACADEVYYLPDFLETEHYLSFISYLIQTRNIRVLMVSNSYRGYYMLPWLRMHFPELVMIDYVHLEEQYWRNGGYARVSGMLGGVLEKTYVCNSATKKVLEDKFGRRPGSVKTLYIGVDEQKFCRKNFEAGYVRRKLKIETERPIILFPCRLHPQKRPFMLLEIAEKVKKREPAAAFVVVGDGPQFTKLKAAVKRRKLENTVFCMGYCECMGECYRDASITLICSLKEGLSLTAYESCAMEVPVISSDVGGQRDLLGDGAGILIPTDQSEENDLDDRHFSEAEVAQYVEAIELLLHDPYAYRKIAEKAKLKIGTEFSLKKMQKNLETEIAFLLEDHVSREKRYRISESLKALEGLAGDYYIIEKNWEDLQEMCEDRLQMIKNGVRALVKKQ